MEKKKENILLAGATGYLGKYIAGELIQSGFSTSVIVRNKQKARFDPNKFNIIEAEATNPASVAGICRDIDVVISTIGITRQKDGLTYMDVDYQANVNLIEEAKANGVRKFIYVSVFNGEKLTNLKICEAKEKLVHYLISSGLEYCIIRPNGFFSDMADFLNMAKSGRVYLFGDGQYKLNPIHGEDLAKVCVNAIGTNDKEINIGGPDLLTQNEIAGLALQAYSKKIKIVHLPDWLRRFTIWFLRTFTSSKKYGPVEFFMTTMVMDMTSPSYGSNSLKDFFIKTAKQAQ